MAKELLIVRHAKSDWSQPLEDFDRPLNKRGKKEAEKLGQWLLDVGLMPDFIICSPAKRTLKTAARICQSLNLEENQIHFDPRIYEAEVSDLMKVLSECPGTAFRVMLVGHNPGLEDLLVYLVSELPLAADGKILATATLGHLTMPDCWDDLKAGCAELVNLVRAKTL